MLAYHLSDLHLRTPETRGRARVLESLVRAVREEHIARGGGPATLLFTGDVFDHGRDDPRTIVPRFLDLHDAIVDAVGGDARAIVVPGNHDRRGRGVFGPHRSDLFDALGASVDPRRTFVGGRRTPFLADVVPAARHRLGWHVLAYDSSYLATGLVSAGGTIRDEDLLAAEAELDDDDRPVIVLMHHHVIPTPVTDLSNVETGGRPRLTRWLLGKALPALVSHADREELTMTALGAGSALSTLHAFGRGILLLHGHKHVPTARLVRGVLQGSGDVLVASAGSAGKRERIDHKKQPDAARLWPSFNVVTLEDAGVSIDVVAFAPKSKPRASLRRALVRARLDGATWVPEPVPARPSGDEGPVALDEARFVLQPTSGGRFAYECSRTIKLEPDRKLARYVDFRRAAPGAVFVGEGPHDRARRRVELQLGGVTRYRVVDGLCRTLHAGARAYGPGAAYEWVGLLCRYGATTARLVLETPEVATLRAFGSVTDLQTGRERPLRLDRDPHGAVRLIVPRCHARMLLRIYWPLARGS